MARALGHIELSACGLVPDPEFAEPIPLQPGDRMLLASDGLFKDQSTMDVASAECEYAGPGAAAEQLVQRSLQWDVENSTPSDNTTCICVHFAAPQED